jgi:DNA-binding transcriptional MerR regulator
MSGVAELTPSFTIEQLATETGLAYTTIRMYQQRGLLPAPERRGRVGYYGLDHIARLRLIGQLRERGYSLAAIKDLVETWQEGRSLEDVLGLERQAVDVLARSGKIRLRAHELAARFEGAELTPAAMTRAYELGLITFEDDVVVVRAPAFLEVGSALVAMGVPIDEVLDEYEYLRGLADELAQRFAAVFERTLWSPFVEAGMPAEEMAHLGDALASLGPLAEQIVTTTLRQALAVIAAQFLEQQAKILTNSTSSTPHAGTAGEQ